MHDRACAKLLPQGLQLHTVTAGFIDKAYMQPFPHTALALRMHKQWLEYFGSQIWPMFPNPHTPTSNFAGFQNNLS